MVQTVILVSMVRKVDQADEILCLESMFDQNIIYTLGETNNHMNTVLHVTEDLGDFHGNDGLPKRSQMVAYKTILVQSLMY